MYSADDYMEIQQVIDDTVTVIESEEVERCMRI